MMTWITGAGSFLLPGVGQLLRGRIGDALLFLSLALWLHIILGGLAYGLRADMAWAGGLVGAIAFPSGKMSPTVVVTTVLMASVHLFAAWDAAFDPSAAQDAGDAEAPGVEGDEGERVAGDA